MAKYKKRKDGRYMVQIKIGYNDNGKPKYKSIYGRTINDLENKVAEFKSNLNKGIIIDDQNLTVEKWANKWLNTYKINLKSNSYNIYKYCISAHFGPIKDIKLRDLKDVELQQIVNELIKKGNHRAAEIFKSTIHQMLDQAVKSNLLFRNVAANIVLPKRQKMPKRALTDEEIREITELPLTSQARAFIYLMLYCGLRRGEAWALTKNDIDLENKTVTVNKTVCFETTEEVGKKRVIKIDTPKSKSANRTIPMPDVLSDYMTKYLKTIKGLYLFCGDLMTESKFKQMWYEGFIKVYNQSKGGTKDLKVISPDITPHIFRHTYATTLYNAGVDVKTAQYLLGHATIQMTLDIYTHLQKGKEMEAIQKINEHINRQSVRNQSTDEREAL